jgi:hypothetical protein
MRRQMLTIEKQRVVVLLMLGTLIVSNMILLSLISKKDEKLVVMVPTIDKEMVVGTNTVSSDYLLYRAEQIMQLLFNIRHERYEDNIYQLLKQVSSNQKPQFEKQIREVVQDIKDKKYFYVFDKESQEIDTQNLTIIFSGYLETYIYNKRQDNVAFKKYRLAFENTSGLVSLVSFTEIKDHKDLEKSASNNNDEGGYERN